MAEPDRPRRTRPTAGTHRAHPVRTALALVASVVAVLAVTALPAAAGPVAPATQGTGTSDIGAVLGGTVPGLSATVSGGFDNGDKMTVQFAFTNQGSQPVTVRVPRGAIFRPDQPGQQTAVTPAPETSSVNPMLSGDVVLKVPAGQSTNEIFGYCGEHANFGPDGLAAMHYDGVAAAPLRAVLANISTDRPSYDLAQDAVWWLTDRPTYPVTDLHLATLLRGVDMQAFSHHPTRVEVDASYTPEWARTGWTPSGGNNDLGGDGSNPLLPNSPMGSGHGELMLILLVLGLAAAVVIVAIATSRRSLTRPATVASRATGRPTGWAAPPPAHTHAMGTAPGWYPDPWTAGRLRYWDGRAWTGSPPPRR